jgi:hypothetical protein
LDTEKKNRGAEIAQAGGAGSGGRRGWRNGERSGYGTRGVSKSEEKITEERAEKEDKTYWENRTL